MCYQNHKFSSSVRSEITNFYYRHKFFYQLYTLKFLMVYHRWCLNLLVLPLRRGTSVFRTWNVTANSKKWLYIVRGSLCVFGPFNAFCSNIIWICFSFKLAFSPCWNTSLTYRKLAGIDILEYRWFYKINGYWWPIVIGFCPSS